MDLWKKAKSPNYATNKDKLYPYSEIPFQNEYKLVKIPFCVKNLIQHVDYFGLGRINYAEGTIGFPNCYNVNYEFRLVSDHPDEKERGKKIPNRIPMSEGTSFGSTTRNYIKDNSVNTVTVNLKKETVTEIIAQDIARIVNSEQGKVIVYGNYDEQIERLTDELKKMKQLLYCPIYMLPDNLKLTYWKTYRAYLGINELKRELYRNVSKGDIEAAVILTGCLSDPYCGGALADVVLRLLANNVANAIAYAGKIWNNYNKEVVREHFPSVFYHIFAGDCMALINYQNNQELVLEPKTKDSPYKSTNKSGWKIIPIWDDNKVLFKLYNIDNGKYLQLSPTTGEDGVGQASGSKDSEELGDKFYFEPIIIMNGQVAFHIFNDEDNKRLELPAIIDTLELELKVLVGHKSVESDQDEHSSWILSTSSQDKEKSDKKDEQAQSEDEDFSNFNYYD